jgi:hypothetical protein
MRDDTYTLSGKKTTHFFFDNLRDSWEDLEKLFPGRRAGRLATAKLAGLLRLHHPERETKLATTTTTGGTR